MWRPLAATLLAATLALSCRDAPPPPAGPGPSGATPASGPGIGPTASNGTVERVIDGDTIVVTLAGHATHVRLIGIDTPETVKPNSPVECFGPEASDRLHELLPPGTEIALARDREPRDDYDRVLAYVFRASDELFVNLALVADGYANALTIAPNVTFADDFAAAAANARRQQLGLWRACPNPDALFSSVAQR